MVSRLIGTGNKLGIWSGGLGISPKRSLSDNELEFIQFFTVVHVDSIDGGDDTTVLKLKPYFPSHAYRAGNGRPNPAKLDSAQYPFMPLFSGCLCPYFQGACALIFRVLVG